MVLLSGRHYPPTDMRGDGAWPFEVLIGFGKILLFVLGAMLVAAVALLFLAVAFLAIRHARARSQARKRLVRR